MNKTIIEFERGIPRGIAEKLLTNARLDGQLVDKGQQEHWDYDFTQFVADITAIFNTEFIRDIFSDLFSKALLEAFRKLTLLAKRPKENKPTIEVKVNGSASIVRFSIEGDLEDAKQAITLFRLAINQGEVDTAIRRQKSFNEMVEKPEVHFHYDKQRGLYLLNEESYINEEGGFFN